MMNVVETTMTSRLRYFSRLNHTIYLDFMVGENPKEFINGAYKVLSVMGVTSREKAELDLYQ